MEPLGSAYASSSEDVSAVVTATAAPSAAAAKNKRQHSTLKGNSRMNGGSTTATAAAADIAKGTAATPAAALAAEAEAVAIAPPPLLGQSILAATPAEEGAVAIHAMSSEGLAHAEMKEWMVFSDLHVSPSSLDVALQVSVFVPVRPFDSALQTAAVEKPKSNSIWGKLSRALAILKVVVALFSPPKTRVSLCGFCTRVITAQRPPSGGVR